MSNAQTDCDVARHDCLVETGTTHVDILANVNIRRCLSKIRDRWERHSSTNPFCLAEVVENHVTVSDFCVVFLMAQRTRRGPQASALLS